jgi:hypothetical protein
MGKFWSYLGGTVIRPRRTFNQLLNNSNHLLYGFGAILLIGVLYTLTLIGLAVTNTKIFTPAWIAIPPEKYYFYEIFFAIPVLLLTWILAAGLVQLISKSFKGRGNFEGSLAVLGFALTIPMFVTWIPETIGTILFLCGTINQHDWLELTSKPGFWQVFSTGYQFLSIIWYLILFPIATAIAQKVRWWQAIVVGIMTMAISGFTLFIFIR